MKTCQRVTHTRTDTGFTLIEILIVLVIVAIITAVAVMAFGHFGQSRREKIIVEQFVSTIGAATAQAIFTPMVMGLSLNAEGYHYYAYQVSAKGNARWVVIDNSLLTHPSVFAHVLDVRMKAVNTFEPSEDNALPSILILPSGYVTPFVVELTGDTQVFTIHVQNNGSVEMTAHAKH
jgi:general secretion pathway protein H